jgi:hypothetical protein
MVSNYDAFRGQLERCLDLIDQEPLKNSERDSLATGIRVARRSGDELTLPRLKAQHPRAFKFGEASSLNSVPPMRSSRRTK